MVIGITDCIKLMFEAPAKSMYHHKYKIYMYGKKNKIPPDTKDNPESETSPQHSLKL